MADSGSESETEVCEVQKILKRRKVKGKLEYLIRWKGFDSSEDSWEPEDHLIDCKEALELFNLDMNKAKIVHMRSTPKPTPRQSTRSETRSRASSVKTSVNSSSNSSVKESTRTTTTVEKTTSNPILSTGKISHSEKSVRRTLDLKEASFFQRHRCLVIGLLMVFIAITIAAGLKIYEKQTSQ
ncbi:heterochromatin protein 1-like isoform X2 [Ptychodera flava]|uniref:heterochromatin protein 1-like isoform X2 n=1 Tax=Ptychodera flava TaxID=63121 RepID=UPI003969DABE